MTEIDVRNERPAERFIPMAGYALLIASPFFMGITGVIAAVLAYVQRRDATALEASHYRFQLRIFWTAVLVGLLVIAATAAGAAIFAGNMFAAGQAVGWDYAAIDISEWRVDWLVIGLVLAVGLLAVLDLIWLWGASAFGLARLASGRAIGERR